MSKKYLDLNEINTLNLKLSCVNRFHIDFTRQVLFDFWIADVDDKNNPVAKKTLLTFESLKSIKINIGATPWLEFTKPITIEKYSESKHGEIMESEDTSSQLNHYTLSTDEGIIEIIAGFVFIEIIEILPRGCPDC